MPGRNGDFRRGGRGRPPRQGQRGVSLLTPFLAALSFLTIVPATGRREISARQISGSRAWYPPVGLLLGGALWGLAWLLLRALPPLAVAALLVAFLAAATRGLHLDGFMDICDGMFGGYTPERRLEIMKDSHVGAFAVAGGGCLLLVKFAALAALLALPGYGWALLLCPAVSRWAMVMLMSAFPYRRAQGLGLPFQQERGRLATVFALALALLIAAATGGLGGLALLAGGAILAWLFARWLAKLLGGGLTGDCYGATNELIEAATLLAAVALLPHGWLGPGLFSL